MISADGNNRSGLAPSTTQRSIQRHRSKCVLLFRLIKQVRVLQIGLLCGQYVEEVRRTAFVQLIRQLQRLVRSTQCIGQPLR